MCENVVHCAHKCNVCFALKPFLHLYLGHQNKNAQIYRKMIVFSRPSTSLAVTYTTYNITNNKTCLRHKAEHWFRIPSSKLVRIKNRQINFALVAISIAGNGALATAPLQNI